MRETIQDALPLLTGGFVALALLLILISVRLFRRSRTDVFWRRRREAGQRGWRLFLFAFSLLVLASVSCVLTLALGVLDDEDSAAGKPLTATQEATRLAAGLETPDTTSTSAAVSGSNSRPESTSAPTRSESTSTSPPATPMIVIITATPAYSPTPTSFPTFTPFATPAPPGVTPRPGAVLRLIALSDQIDAALRPVNPRTEFAAGTKRIYFFVEFSGMTDGVLWRRAIFKEGELFDDNTYPWGLTSSGTAHFFFGQDSGFEPGAYEIRLYIGESAAPASVMPFFIVSES